MFYIQACTPISNGSFDENDIRLAEAIETIFPMRTEAVIMVWNYISISLSYKYDISYMINDIIKLLQELIEKKEGKLKINWLPDTFSCQWNIKWYNDIVEVDSQWISVVGEIVDNLNKVPTIISNKWDFINEWERVFYYVNLNLEKCGYNDKKLVDMNQFSCINSMFKGKGILYQQH